MLTFSILAAWPLWAQRDTAPEEPPEEDEAYATKEYSFNPLQAEQELKVGNFYFRRGNYRAASARFREATKWNGQYAEAWRRLGEALERWKDLDAAREAYEKYLDLEPEGRHARDIRRKLSGKS